MDSIAVHAGIYQLGEREGLNSSGDWDFIGTMIILQYGERIFLGFLTTTPRSHCSVWASSKKDPNGTIATGLFRQSGPVILFPFGNREALCQRTRSNQLFPGSYKTLWHTWLDATGSTNLRSLKLNPHQNIAQYHGCVRGGKWIWGLCFTRYSKTLRERLDDDTIGHLHRRKISKRSRRGWGTSTGWI